MAGRALALTFLLASLAACDMPNYEGPQLQEPPQGFLLRSDTEPGSTMFADRSHVYYDAWVQSLPPYSTIRIHGFAGTLTLDDVIAAQERARGRRSDPDITLGRVEPMTIDGRDAWGWEERIDTPTRGIPWVAYRVMIPYDTISYTVEISTEDPLFKAGAPETLRAVVGTFGVGETVWNWPLIAVAAGLLFFVLHMLRQRSQAKTARLQSINLVKIEKKEEEDSAEHDSTAETVVDVGHEGR